MLPPLTVLSLFFLSSLHCLRAISKHCLPLFFFTIDFCMFCVSLMFLSYVLAKVMLHWEGFCLFSVVPSSSLFLPCSVIYLCFIGEFLFAFFGLSWDEIRRDKIWMHQEIKRNAKIMTTFFRKDQSWELWFETQSTAKKKKKTLNASRKCDL